MLCRRNLCVKICQTHDVCCPTLTLLLLLLFCQGPTLQDQDVEAFA